MPAPSNLLKFRPVLTLSQLRTIARMCQANEASSLYPDATSILHVVVPMIAKVEVGAINPAYKLSETHALKTQETLMRTRYENGEMSAQEEADYEAKILGV